MNYEQSIDYINSFTHLGSKPGLERTEELLEKLGSPHKKLKFVHVAGTNGKGSTCAILASILSAAGYRTGLYTSPYLVRFTESIAINSIEIPQPDVAQLVSEIAPIADTMEEHPTVFELKTCLAFLYFLRSGCDIVVCEVGMGGRLDSTNVIPFPEVAVITNIGLDHTEQLGSTVSLIAGEKAGIIKQECECVVYDQSEEAMSSIQSKALLKNAVVHRADFTQLQVVSDTPKGQSFTYKSSPVLFSHLLGANQRHNAATALEAVGVLCSRGWNIPWDAVQSGLEQTVWPARFEVFHSDIDVVVDGGHNPQCARSVTENLAHYFPGKRVIFVIGVLADKDYKSVIGQYLPLAFSFITLTPDSPRALSASSLAEYINTLGCPAEAFESIPEAMRRAKEACERNSVICATGSLYLVGAIRELMLTK